MKKETPEGETEESQEDEVPEETSEEDSDLEKEIAEALKEIKDKGETREISIANLSRTSSLGFIQNAPRTERLESQIASTPLSSKTEDEKDDLQYAVKYNEKDTKEYSEVPKTGDYPDVLTPSQENFTEVGKREDLPFERQAGLINAEAGRMGKENRLEQKYVESKKMDMQKVGREKIDAFGKKVEEKKYTLR